MDQSAAMQTWEVIEHAMDEIYSRNASQLSFEELYRAGYNLVLHKHGHLLYDGVSFKISSQLQQQQQQLLLNVSDQDQNIGDGASVSAMASTSLLQHVAHTWKVRSYGVFCLQVAVTNQKC
jgi:Cullin family